MAGLSSIDDEFLKAVSRFATGAVVVTTLLDGKPHCSNAQAFCSLLPEPKLVLVALNSRGRTILRNSAVKAIRDRHSHGLTKRGRGGIRDPDC
jgi:flavin reductase (DIM6/NTAB) family NADH-FMN oxidoreductase RutF